jgi:phenylpyruvate tautomerase PptA (4-oxalocrotonate tautomerase family)
MPVVKITTNFSIGEIKKKLCQDLHEMMQHVLRIKEYDRLIVLDERPDNFYQPLNTEGKYALIEISLFAGRKAETKRRLYQEIANLFDRLGVNKFNTRIILYEIQRENWGIRGGKAANDVNLGFDTNV